MQKSNVHLNASRRGNLMEDAPFYALEKHEKMAISKGVKVLHLNIGQPNIETPKTAIEAVNKSDSKIIAYGPSAGRLSLRTMVAEYYNSFQATVDPTDVLVTIGASEAIMFTFLSCMDVDDEVIIPEPFYANYNGFATACSAKVIPIPSAIEEEFKLPDVKAFKSLLNARTKAIMLCNPGNPTGQLYSKDALSEILDFAIKYDLYLIVDEVYREFCYDETFRSILSFAKGANNVIVIDSASKVFSLCGARIGFLVSKNRDILKAAHKYAQLRLCPPFLGQIMAEACYSNRSAYIRSVHSIYKERSQLLYLGLKLIKGIKYYKPRAAFYNIIELPVEDALHFCQWLLSEFSVDNETIMLAPAEGFYADPERGKSQVRLAFMLDKAELERALNILKMGLETYLQINAEVKSKGFNN